jgi:hypothetical protein
VPFGVGSSLEGLRAGLCGVLTGSGGGPLPLHGHTGSEGYDLGEDFAPDDYTVGEVEAL